MIKIASVKIDNKTAAMLKSREWSFDWDKPAHDLISGTSIFKAAIIDEQIEGLVEYEILQKDAFAFMHKLEIDPLNRGKDKKHEDIAGILLAFVAVESFNAGCDGFVVFVSKSSLFDYYQEHYGAQPVGGLRLHFDTAASRRLIERYLKDRKDIHYE